MIITISHWFLCPLNNQCLSLGWEKSNRTRSHPRHCRFVFSATCVPLPPLWPPAITYQICCGCSGSHRVNMEEQRSPTSKHGRQFSWLMFTCFSFLGWWKLPRSTTRWVTSPSVKQRDSWSVSLRNSHPRNTLSTKKVCMCCSSILSICTKENLNSFERSIFFLCPPTTSFRILFLSHHV